jgi:hypothetical protein
MVTLGNLELRAGHPHDAVRWLERAVVLRARDRDAAEMLAPAELGLARALWATGSQEGRALSLAERARDQLTGSAKKDELAEVNAFLAQAKR